jgi:hypothetical protein
MSLARKHGVLLRQQPPQTMDGALLKRAMESRRLNILGSLGGHLSLHVRVMRFATRLRRVRSKPAVIHARSCMPVLPTKSPECAVPEA